MYCKVLLNYKKVLALLQFYKINVRFSQICRALQIIYSLVDRIMYWEPYLFIRLDGTMYRKYIVVCWLMHIINAEQYLRIQAQTKQLLNGGQSWTRKSIRRWASVNIKTPIKFS